jgi:arginine deiminase
MMNLHLDTFMRMKDKDQVAMYLNRFLASTAYLGYTKDVNMEQLTQVFRRIYKTP